MMNVNMFCEQLAKYVAERDALAEENVKLKELVAELSCRAAVVIDIEENGYTLCNFCNKEHYEHDEPPCDDCRQGESFVQRSGTKPPFCTDCYYGGEFKYQSVEVTKLKQQIQAIKQAVFEEFELCSICKYIETYNEFEPCKSCRPDTDACNWQPPEVS